MHNDLVPISRILSTPLVGYLQVLTICANNRENCSVAKKSNVVRKDENIRVENSVSNHRDRDYGQILAVWLPV